jgi:hypothetical protein
MKNIFIGNDKNIEINIVNKFDQIFLNFNFNLNCLRSTSVSEHRGCLPIDITIYEALQLSAILAKYIDKARKKNKERD